MSDDNYRKPSSPRATRIGLGLIGADGSYDGHPGASASGADMRGTSARTMGGMQTGANSGLAEVESDTRYMDPPSESHGVERDEIVRRLHAETEASTSRAGGTGNAGLFGSTLRAQTSPPAQARDHTHDHGDDYAHANTYEADVQPTNAGDPGLFRTALDHTLRPQPSAAPVTTRPPPPPPSGSRAPEAWRNEVRRMVERAPTKGPTSGLPGSSGSSPQQPSGMGGYGGPNTPGGASLPPSNKPSLRLKLDADAVAVEEAYRAPKSGLPKLLTWLMILGLIGGGFWFFAESRGGVAALIQQFSGGQPTLTTQEPAAPAANPAAPALAAPQPPAAAAPATAEPAQVPQQAAPTEPSAKPQPASAAPVAPSGSAPAAAAPASNPASATKLPAAPAAQAEVKAPTPTNAPAKPAAPKAPPRQVRPQHPVVKVRPIESPSTAEPPAAAPPDGLDIPYVPLPGDPPAPDEAR